MFTAIVALAAALSGGAPQRVEVQEGWYRVEEGYGETPDAEIALVLAEDDSAALEAEEPPPGPEASPAPGPDDEIAHFLRVDCEAVRGRYLARLLTLHGVDTSALDVRALAAWTRRRPPPESGWLYHGTLGDPALAPLYGEPPIPAGPLSFDLELQSLARDLLSCDARPTPAQ